MKRKDLEKLPVLRATTAMLKQAEQEPMTQAGYYKNKRVYAHDFYARCRRFGAILKVAFYKTELLTAGGRQPRYELFLNRKEQDFLTYAYAEKSWRTSMLHNLYRFGDLPYNIRFSEQDKKLICEYLGSKEEPYRAIQKFQVQIREQQLLARYRKETNPWDAAMALVPPLPKDWDRWVGKVGVAQNYMFYQYQRGGAKTGYCSYCDRTVPIRKPKHNTLTKCPRCRKQVQFKAFGKMGRFRTEKNVAYLMQQYPGGFVIREFWAERSYSRENYRNVKAFYHEFRRAIFDADAKPVQAFYWGLYKQRSLHWIRGYNSSADFARAESGRVYGKTIPSLAKTVLQRTGLPELICAGKAVNPETYLVVLKKIPELERLSKAGLFSLARECAQSYYWLENRLQKAPEQKGLAAMLGIDRMELARLRRYDGGKMFLEWLQYEKQSRHVISDRMIQWLCGEHIHPERLQFIADRMHIGQIQHYLRRQMQESGMSSKEVLGTWQDYLSMAARFGYDANDSIIYRVRKLRQRHDELARRCDNQKLALRAAEILRTYPHLEQNLHAIREKFSFADEQFQLQVPNVLEDILKESRTLCHCIANSDTYWERLERKESYLLFVRKAAAPDTPYYTVEAEPNGTVRQVRTQYNRQNDDIGDVRTFLKNWQKQLAKRLSQEDKQLAKDSRELRIRELVQLRSDKVTIHTGDYAGRMLVDVLTEDLMEAA